MPMQEPSSTLLFHLSDELRDSFSSATSKRPTFYWFNDSYHSHILGDTPSFKYMYFFVIKPEDKVKLLSRHGNGDFASLWSDFCEYLETRSVYEKSRISKYLEPAIVMSFDELKPVLIGELYGDYMIKISDVSFSLKKGEKFRKFTDIPELVKLCPSLITSIPFMTPNESQIHNPNRFWSTDKQNLGRSWL